MTMLDLHSDLDVSQDIATVAHNGNAAVEGTGVDFSNYTSCVVIFEAGAVTDGTHTPTVEESNDGTTWTTVAAADLHGTLVPVTTANDPLVQTVGYKGEMSNVRAVWTDATSTTGAVTGALIILGGRKHTGGSPIIA